MSDERLPCQYPDCKDHEGNPRMTSDGVCIAVRKDGTAVGCQIRLRRDIRRLCLDWVHLHTALPQPLRGDNIRTVHGAREYGHPSEWSSDTAALIAGIINDVHDDLAEALGATPPPHPGTSELVRVRAGWTFLEPRIADLSQQEWVGDTATEIIELHRNIRARLGHTKPRYTLPTPCPNIDCGLKTLQRTIHAGSDTIECGACGYVIAEQHYPFFVRLILDTLIEQAA